jgi:hypothetical protein
MSLGNLRSSERENTLEAFIKASLGDFRRVLAIATRNKCFPGVAYDLSMQAWTPRRFPAAPPLSPSVWPMQRRFPFGQSWRYLGELSLLPTVGPAGGACGRSLDATP